MPVEHRVALCRERLETPRSDYLRHPLGLEAPHDVAGLLLALGEPDPDRERRQRRLGGLVDGGPAGHDTRHLGNRSGVLAYLVLL